MCLFAAAAVPAMAGLGAAGTSAGIAGGVTAAAIGTGAVAAGTGTAAAVGATLAAGAAGGAAAAAATTPLWLKLAYAGASIGSSMMQANAAQQTAKSQSALYDYQANMAKTQADEALKYGDLNSRLNQTKASAESKDLMRKLITTEGAQKAAMGALKIGGATAEDIVSDTFYKGRADEIALKHTADLASWKFKTDAANQAWKYNAEAGQYSMASSNAKKAGRISSGNSLLSGIASTALGVMML
jgi:hypothetical protein